MNTNLLKFALYSAVLNLFFTPISSSIAVILGYLTILLFFASVLYSTIYTKKLKLNRTVLGFIIAVIISLVVNLNSLNIASLGNVVDIILPIGSFIVFYMAIITPVTNGINMVLEDVFKANYMLCGVLLLYAFGPFDFKYTIINAYGGKLFTMGLGNPNATSLCVMFAIVILLIQITFSLNKYIKGINIILAIFLLNVLWRLSSRTVFFCVLVVIVFFLLKLSKVMNVISYIVVAAPLFMIVFQLSFIDDLTIQLLGKAIDTGRQDLYVEMLEVLENNPAMFVWGNICEYPFYNAHNGLLSIMVALGIIGVILYIVFWNQQLKILRTCCVERYQKIAFVTVMAFLIHASAEAMAVVGTIPYSMFVIIIIRIAKGDIRDQNDGITKSRVRNLKRVHLRLR